MFLSSVLFLCHRSGNTPENRRREGAFGDLPLELKQKWQSINNQAEDNPADNSGIAFFLDETLKEKQDKIKDNLQRIIKKIENEHIYADGCDYKETIERRVKNYIDQQDQTPPPPGCWQRLTAAVSRLTSSGVGLFAARPGRSYGYGYGAVAGELTEVVVEVNSPDGERGLDEPEFPGVN